MDTSPPPPPLSKFPLLIWWQRQNGNVRGGLWMLVAALMFSISVAIIKTIGERISIFEILFFRQLGMIILASPVVIRGLPGSLITKRPDLQVLRVIFATLAMTLGFSAFIHLPLSEATAIGFSKTMFITIFAILFLKETVGIRRWSAVLIGFIGVLVMITPQDGWIAFSGFNIWSLSALAGAAAAGLVMVIIRKLTKVDQPITILSYQAVLVGVLMALPTYYYWIMPTWEEWLLLGVLSLFSVFAQMCNIRAYKVGEATAISSIDYTRLIYASVLGWLLFAEIPHLNTLAGAAIIIAASLYTLNREAKRGKELARAKESRVYNQ
ncbi:MAG: DMT family transporter [Hyphomicrobiales bacterium]